MEALPKSLEVSVFLADAVSHNPKSCIAKGALLGPRHLDNVGCVRAVCVPQKHVKRLAQRARAGTPLQTNTDKNASKLGSARC